MPLVNLILDLVLQQNIYSYGRSRAPIFAFRRGPLNTHKLALSLCVRLCASSIVVLGAEQKASDMHDMIGFNHAVTPPCAADILAFYKRTRACTLYRAFHLGPWIQGTLRPCATSASHYCQHSAQLPVLLVGSFNR